MSVLIKGMDVSPDHIQCITVFPEGFAVVEEYEMLLPIKTTKCEVISVPTPHGRLIDAEKLMQEFEKAQKSMEQHGREFSFSFISSSQEISTEWYCVELFLDDAPTVIEAEEVQE